MTVTNWVPVPSVFAITNCYRMQVVENYEEYVRVMEFSNSVAAFSFLAVCFLATAYLFKWAVSGNKWRKQT